MKKEFDFDDIGKHTPYRTPEGFFEDVQQQVMERAGIKRQRRFRLRLVISSVMTAAILAGFFFIPILRQSEQPVSDRLAIEKNHETADPVDKWINELSDEELEELVNFSENDLFLN